VGRTRISQRRPKRIERARIVPFMLEKTLIFIHSTLGKVAQNLASKGGAALASWGIATEDNAQAIIGAIAVLLGALADWTVRSLDARFIRKRQAKIGATVDGWAGPETNAAEDAAL